jgi:glycine/D-amino acid oxidase-like deaminating enzyme
MPQQQVLIIGCGVVGAMLAYDLSEAGFAVTVWESCAHPAQGATRASLGVLMAACSQKTKGDLVTLRLASLSRYDRLTDELTERTGIDLSYNRHGILCLYATDEKTRCQELIRVRQEQGLALHWLDRNAVATQYTQWRAQGGLYSPCDRAVHPVQLVRALVLAAQQNGAKFFWNQPLPSLDCLLPVDWTVVAAGLGCNDILAAYSKAHLGEKRSPLLQAVGGQAITMRVLDLNLQTVVHAEDANGDDINIVPLGGDRYWVGATVEFDRPDLPCDTNIALLRDRGAAFCPAFADAEVLETWAGDRPRPRGLRAPILGFLPGYRNVLIATGHYRNGILMAPVTARITCDLISCGDSDLPWRTFSLDRVNVS